MDTVPSEPEYRDLVVGLTTQLLQPTTARLNRHLCNPEFFANSVLRAAPDEIPPSVQPDPHLQTAISSSSALVNDLETLFQGKRGSSTVYLTRSQNIRGFHLSAGPSRVPTPHPGASRTLAKEEESLQQEKDREKIERNLIMEKLEYIDIKTLGLEP